MFHWITYKKVIRGDTKNHKTIYTIYVHMYRLNCCDHILSLHSTYSMHVQLDVVCMHSRTYAVHTYVYIDEIQLIKCIESCCPRSTYCACRAWQSLLPHTTICRRIFRRMSKKKWCPWWWCSNDFQFSVLFLIIDVGHAFNIIGINKQMLYEYVGNVLVGSKPQDEGRPAPPTTGWIVRGKLTLQRQNELFMAAAVSTPDHPPNPLIR